MTGLNEYKFFISVLRDYKEKNPTDSRSNITDILDSEETKLFITDKTMNWFFTSTNPAMIKEKLRYPFKQIVINDNIKIDDINYLSCIGLFFTDGMKYDTINCDLKEELLRPKVGVTTCLRSTKIKNVYTLFDFSLYLDNGKIARYSTKKLTKIEKDIYDSVSKYVLNFLLFMNEPRVVTYIVSPNNKRRVRNGLIPIPSQLITKITPELKEYINVSYKKSNSTFGYRFDVHGHWRVLSHPRYKNNVGKKIWIPPYEKGEGLKPPQIFKICKR